MRPGFPWIWRFAGPPTRCRPEPDLAVYRIVQESLTNVLKHASASHVHVLIDRQADQVMVEVVDDGQGVGSPSGSANGRATGHGLRGMQERVTALGGSFRSGRAADGGFAVRAVLPTEESP